MPLYNVIALISLLYESINSPCSCLRVCYRTLIVLTVAIDSICCGFSEAPLILKSELEGKDCIINTSNIDTFIDL